MASSVAAHPVINRSIWAYDQSSSQFRHGRADGDVTLLVDESGTVNAVGEEAADQWRINFSCR